ncbi:hypothetical protein [Sphingomonas sp. 22176]|uniref:hypothetical protein n=1 Tax=Sphingomonas sp. 22176 TaxID=3453884 RepID=UPI003F8487E1
MAYHLCLVQPEGYAHSGALLELAELVFHGLSDLGHPVTIALNEIREPGRNILVGAHLLDHEVIDRLPEGTILLNSEQLQAEGGGWTGVMLHAARRFEIWDYSPRNVARLAQVAAHTRLLPIGFHPALDRIAPAAEQDIDVLFYGSINPRRRAVLDGLAAAGLRVEHLFGVYGTDRDAVVARSKLVLNVHYYPTHIFEIIRVFYLMANGKPVVSEVAADTAVDPVYLPGIAACPYEGLVERCVALVGDQDARRSLEVAARAAIRKVPQAERMAAMLALPLDALRAG